MTNEGFHRIIPCLDVRDGRVVKGIRFQNLRDAGDPAELAARYEAQGADEIVVLDIAAAPRGLETRLDTVRHIREKIHIPLTVGGGVRTVEDAHRLLKAGADRISVNTAAVNDPTLLRRLADAFGSQCITLAIDARRSGESWEVLIVGGRESAGLNAVEWARAAEETGAGEILLTSWDRDGTRSGADIELISAVSESVHIPVIASGGIGSVEDSEQAIKAGAAAVLAASIFHDGDRVVKDLKNYLKESGIAVRI
ncbi:MAG: imidazole glycerol phosphate synthase subunit HisF [Bacteroidetes bacterium]|nr:imidazole glycerol phosphate synthase subunit HisF [Bacteroidota bacterium]